MTKDVNDSNGSVSITDGNADDDRTQPGIGPLATISNGVNRAIGSIRTLVDTLPAPGHPMRERHFEVLELACGEAGMLLFDTMHAIAAQRRKEFGK